MISFYYLSRIYALCARLCTPALSLSLSNKYPESTGTGVLINSKQNGFFIFTEENMFCQVLYFFFGKDILFLFIQQK
jgi:hypothetical protein